MENSPDSPTLREKVLQAMAELEIDLAGCENPDYGSALMCNYAKQIAYHLGITCSPDAPVDTDVLRVLTSIRHEQRQQTEQVSGLREWVRWFLRGLRKSDK